MKARIGAVAVALLLLLLADSGRAYYATGPKWRPGTTVTLQMQLGSSSSALIDGSPDWDAVADSALNTWSPFVNGITLRATRGSSVVSAGDRVNTVSFGDDVYGSPFGSGVLAITEYMYRSSDRSLTEADVIFNHKFSWNSYRGNLRSASGGGSLIDLRRVAIHEFGHVIGLDHPDDHGQSVRAVMNSHVGNVDGLTTDDVDGALSIYGGTQTTQTASTSTLASGARLLPGQALVSPNAQFRLAYQVDGNLVLYDDVAHAPVWWSDTAGTSAGFAAMQGDGNFVLYDAAGVFNWNTVTAGNTAARLVVQSDGNVVIYRTDGVPVWDRISSPGGSH